jgi:hypothetical protein
VGYSIFSIGQNKMSESRAMLQKYSIGVVAANKGLNTNVIEVLPAEHFPMVDGELTSNATKYQAAGVDANGNSYADSLNTALSVSATWIALGSMNRTTSPDVRRGERVQLYRYADSDAYYWTTLTDDLSIRRLETVAHAYSGTADESTTALDGTNSYFHEVSTHNGYMHWHTSKANGEPFGYDVQINAKTGFVTIQDDVGNAMRMDSANCMITLQNAQGSSIVLDKTNGTVTVPDTWTVNAKTIIENCTDYTVSASNSWTVKSNTGKMTFSNLSITAQTTHKGNVGILGNLGLNGDMTTLPGGSGSTGTINMAGNMNLKGNMDMDGVISAQQGAKFGGTVQAQTIISIGNIVAPNV